MQKIFATSACWLPALIALAMPLSPASAQDAKRYLPPVTQDVSPTVIGPELVKGSTDTKTLVPSLRGVSVIGRPGKGGHGGKPGLVILDKTVLVPEKVKAAITSYLGKPVSLSSINQLTNDIVIAYRDCDLPVVNVVAPAQDITGGNLQLVIVVGRLAELKVEGARYVDPVLYLRNSTLKKGEPINGGALLDDLRWLNRSPFRRVDAVYTPGTAFGTTDVILRPVEQRPFTVYGGYNNDGNRTIGLDRVFVGALASNMLGLNETLGYQITTDKLVDHLIAHAVTAQIPVTMRSELQFTGTYVTSKADINNDFGSTGLSSSIGAYYLMQMPRFAGVANDLRLGYEHKETNNNLEFGGTTVTNSSAYIDQLVGNWTGEKIWDLGHSRFNLSVFGSPGNISSDNNSAAFQALRSGARADYVYSRLELDHRIDLPQDWRVLFTFNGQISNANLLPSETLTLGGQGSVRGFETNITRADSGATANLTLYTPGVTIVSKVPVTDYLSNLPRRYDKGTALIQEVTSDQIRGEVFLDGGYGINKDHVYLPGEGERRLASTGVGFIYEFGRFFSSEVAYGWQLKHDGFNQTGNASFLHLRATARF